MGKFSASVRPPFNKRRRLFFGGGQPLSMLLSAGLGGEGEEHLPVDLATEQRLPKRCYGAATSSSSPMLRRRPSREALQRGTYAGDNALPPYHMVD
jgi:hypothetical protein